MSGSPEEAAFDAAPFPLSPKGRRYEDFEVGQVIRHHWGRTITAGDNAAFSTAMCNWNPMHLNAEFARAHGHPDIVVNPMLVLCTAVGLSVEDLSEAGGPFLGVEDCRFHRALYPGETITVVSTVLDKRESASRPGTGIVTWRSEAHNQRGELVVDYERTNLVAQRSP
ncbi:MAG TPA: MaoC family dehydratase [Acidimicrobiales bacterium]|nr:MaoC family dehydratase [Acidimicrobiales bacterium]